jgi:hypothetical protein
VTSDVFSEQASITLDDTLEASKAIEEMIGEAFRDIGILTFVFAILDKVISGKITPWWTVAAIAVSVAFFGAGCYIERRRPNG